MPPKPNRRARRAPAGTAKPHTSSPPNASALPKLSDTLSEFASPLLDALPSEATVKDVKGALDIAVFCWNMPVLRQHAPPAAAAATDSEVTRKLATMPPVIRALIEALMTERQAKY